MHKEKRIRIPFWLQILGILSLGVLASIAVWLAAPRPELPKHTVTFAYLDGTVIETVEVEEGKGVYPPELPDEGVFRGWSKPFNAVTEDVEAHPRFHSIAENNLFYFHAVYVEEGTDFDLELYVGGSVSISSGELTVLYDPAVLTYQKAASLEGCEVTQVQSGELLVKFHRDTPLKEETLLSQLVFHAEEKDAYSTELVLQAENMKIAANGEQLPADCATINNKVYFLQEVE